MFVRGIVFLTVCLLLSACAGGDERTIYVDNSVPKSSNTAASDRVAYDRWRRQQPTKEFYSAGTVVLKPPLVQEKKPVCRLLENGLASWYGYELYGNNTANGEKFEPDGISAAHKTLPFGTIVKVMLVNGKGDPEGVYVRINDRGPFVHGRIIDLSLGAAKKLGMKDTQPVHVYTCT